MLGVPEGTEVMRRLRVSGPQAEPPFQINDNCIHPRGVADAPEVAAQEQGPGGWLYRLEAAGHGPLSWAEYHRARMPAKDEAGLLQIPVTLPVLEIVRVGRSVRDGQPIEVTVHVIPSDRVETLQVLHRDESAAWPWPDQPNCEPGA
jgi:DNA-binding GntR family transcriptional regulator